MIKCQSAGQLHYDKLYDYLYWDEYRSCYDPKDYEDVPVVPKKKIAKYIEKGRFRKGQKLTIEEKLKRFAESIKPTQEVSQDYGYMNKWLYWKPPKQLKKGKVLPPKETD